MSGLLPSHSEVESGEGEPRVVGVDSDGAGQLLSALSSKTARSLYADLHDRPATPSELAERTDTSLQNTQYHLGNLQDADLIEECDTRYSEKGREMTVYAAADAPVVLFAGSQEEGESVQTALTSLLGGVGLLGVASLVVQTVFGTGLQAPERSTETGAAQSASDFSGFVIQIDKPGPRDMPMVGGDAAGQAAGQAAGTLPVGLVFFLGGLLVLSMVAAAWYVRR